MTAYNVVNPASMASGQPEDVSQVLANFNAIAAVLNGNIDDANVKAGAAIAIAKLAGYPADLTKFLRGDGTWAAPTVRRVITGVITGATGAIVRGTGFTAVRNSAGVYTITFTTPFTSLIPVLNVETSNGAPSGYSAQGLNSVQILTYSASFVAADADFNFTVTELS